MNASRLSSPNPENEQRRKQSHDSISPLEAGFKGQQDIRRGRAQRRRPTKGNAMGVSDEIRRLKGKKSAELLARERRAAKRQAGRLEKHLQNNRAPGSMNDPWFMSQLRKAAQQAKERAGEAPRPDLDAAIAVAREKGHLPAAHEGKTGYVPTVEEILGDQATSKPPAPPGVETEDLPSAEDVLNGTPVDGSAFTAEELEEIRRMNPPRAVAPASSPHKHGKHHKRR